MDINLTPKNAQNQFIGSNYKPAPLGTSGAGAIIGLIVFCCICCCIFGCIFS
jgi:hypothetical protein